MAAPNVLVIVLDAVRPDHLSCYGHHRETTPNIDELAANGVRFENAFANSNWTPTSHGSMFTGMVPSHSGVYSHDLNLPTSMPTLPELMREQGYRTFATSAGIHIRRGRGYDRGFDNFEETYRISPNRGGIKKLLTNRRFRKQARFTLTRGPDDKTLYKFDTLRDWISANDDPFFAFVNCKTAHNPYNPPRPYKGQYGPALNRPRYELLERLQTHLFGESQRIDGFSIKRLRHASENFPVMAGETTLTKAEWDVIKAWYDGAIRYLDERIGELVAFLRDEELMDKTYVVITADHGELFGEHGLTKHTLSLYDPVLRVPLVVSPPDGGMNRTVANMVSLVDLFPTVLDMANAKLPDYEHATSLLPLNGGQTYHDHTFAEVGRKTLEAITRRHPSFTDSIHNGPLQSVRDDQYKLIKGHDRVELYDWREDPGELNDISKEEPDIAAGLRNKIADELGSLDRETARETVDAQLEEHLRHLGYR